MRLLKLSFLSLVCALPLTIGCGPSSGTQQLGDTVVDPESMTSEELAESEENPGEPPPE